MHVKDLTDKQAPVESPRDRKTRLLSVADNVRDNRARKYTITKEVNFGVKSLIQDDPSLGG